MLPMADIYTIFPYLLEDCWLSLRNAANQKPLKNAAFVISIVYVNLFNFSVKLITCHFPDSHDTVTINKV